MAQKVFILRIIDMVNFFIFLIQINYYKNVVQIIWIKKIDENEIDFYRNTYSVSFLLLC